MDVDSHISKRGGFANQAGVNSIGKRCEEPKNQRVCSFSARDSAITLKVAVPMVDVIHDGEYER